MLNWFKKKDNEENKQNVTAKVQDERFNKTDSAAEPLNGEVLTSEVKFSTAAAEELPNYPAIAPSTAITGEGQKQATEQIQPAPLTYKEARALKKARYEEIIENPRFKNSYVLLNTKTGQIVEIKAASSFHACNIIGWKSNRVKVLQINSTDKTEEASTVNK